MLKRLMLVALTAGLVGAQLTADAVTRQCHCACHHGIHFHAKHVTPKHAIRKAVKKAICKHAVKKIVKKTQHAQNAKEVARKNFRQSIGALLLNYRRAVLSAYQHAALSNYRHSFYNQYPTHNPYYFINLDNRLCLLSHDTVRYTWIKNSLLHTPQISTRQSSQTPLCVEVVCGPCSQRYLWINKGLVRSLRWRRKTNSIIDF